LKIFLPIRYHAKLLLIIDNQNIGKIRIIRQKEGQLNKVQLLFGSTFQL